MEDAQEKLAVTETGVDAAASASTADDTPEVSSRKPTKMYWIECSGTGLVAMDDVRLDVMFEKMPSLKFLLMGHPNMKKKDLRRNKDGTEILVIHKELGISKSSFVLLVNNVFNNITHPHHESRLDELIDTIVTLGGCSSLEHHLTCKQQNNPMTPSEDVDHKFDWMTIPNHFYQDERVKSARRQGFIWTKTEYGDNIRQCQYIFRAPKLDQCPQPRSASGSCHEKRSCATR